MCIHRSVKVLYLIRASCLLLVFTLGCTPLLQAQLPTGFRDQKINGPWQYPAGITFADNGQGYLWDNDGIVYVLDTAGQVYSTPLLDIREEVVRFLNQGMLGFVLDPDFLENGYCYALYSVDPHHWKHFGTLAYDPSFSEPYRATLGRISRFTADAATGFRQMVPGSQKILVGQTPADGFPLVFESHAIGSLVFGADGSLLASCGDGASSISVDIGSNPHTYYQDGLEEGIIRPEENVGVFRSQMLNSLAGKVIRVDPATGDGLPGNPYFEAAARRSARSRVWALGLRNPFRMAYVPGTGGHTDSDPGWFLIGDVGEGSWEEINLLQQSGQNFGWPFLEGFEPHPDYSQLDIAHPEYSSFCAESSSFQTIYEQGGTPDCCSDCPAFSPSTPRLAYRNRWNDITSPELVLARDISHNATGVSPTETDYVFAGAPFQGDASIGGCFYTGTVYPEAYRGLYFHADYRDWIRAFQLDAAGNLVSVIPFYPGVEKIISLAMNPADGLLYFISMQDFTLHRLAYGGPRPARATIQADQYWGDSPLSVSFSAVQSEGASTTLQYEWLFGEGQYSTQVDPVYIFQSAAPQPTVVPVRLVVSDTLGQRDTAHTTIVLNDRPPQVRITTPIADLHYPMDGTYPILAEAEVIDQHSPLTALQFDWTLLLQHEDHTHIAANSRLAQPSFLLSPAGCVEDEYAYLLHLTVSDENGLSASDQTSLYPDCTEEDWVIFDFIRLSPNGNSIDVLHWQTSREVEVSSFVIEAGTSVHHFQELLAVPAQNQLGGHTYQVELPLAGENFDLYRIRAISNRPAFRLSPLVLPDPVPTTDFARLLQQPVGDALILEFMAAASRRSRVALYDPTGKQLAYFFQESSIGQAVRMQVDVSHLPGGLYYYQLTDGPRTQWGRVIKQ